MVTALVAAGKQIYLPLFGAHSRVGLICEDESGFHRVQCKSSRISRGAVIFATCSNTKNVRKDYRDDVDLFGVYSPELAKVFLVPVSDVPSRLGTLRLDAARNGQTRGVPGKSV